MSSKVNMLDYIQMVMSPTWTITVYNNYA